MMKTVRQVAELAIKQFGSVEKYTKNLKHNLKHFSEIMEKYGSGASDYIRKAF